MPFTALTLEDVEKLRRKRAVGSAHYSFTAAQVEQARLHLQTLYPNCRVQTSFAEKILLLNKIYN